MDLNNNLKKKYDKFEFDSLKVKRMRNTAKFFIKLVKTESVM